MFKRAFRTSPSHDRRWWKGLAPIGVALALVGAPLAFFPVTAGATAPVLTQDTTPNGCEGVVTTPGSANTNKRLDPTFPSDFNPGGTVGYVIDFPVDAADVNGDFAITDCVFVDGTAVAKYFVSFVPNSTAFELRFAVPIPANTVLGAEFCNYAKTTQSPSASPASNRKAGPACFIVGGGLRIEKRSGSATGPLLPGASFSVVCSPTASLPPTIITGLAPSHSNSNGTVSATGMADDGTIAIVGPSGTPCIVTETAAPAGYQLDATARSLVIPIGTSQTINVFVNRQLGSLTITKAANVAGSFTFDVDCSDNAFDRSNVVAVPGTPYVLTGIPTGTVCHVTEDANPDFTQTLVVPGNGTVTIDADGETVAFTNTRNVGSLTITKAANAAGSFTFDVDCSDDAFDRNNVSASPDAPYVLTGIPTGTVCHVAEDANPDFTQTLVVPGNGTVTIDADGETVAFTNTRNVGGLTVTKTTNGGTGTFTFHVNCDGTEFDQDLHITNSGSQTVSGIPTGTSCAVTEASNSLFSSIVVPANGTVTIDANGETVAFTNTRNVGSLTIVKTTNGGTGTFTFDVNCDGTAYDQAVEITNSGSYTISGIPTETSCTVTERDNPLFSSIVIPGDGTVVIDREGQTVAFTNTRNTGPLTITKTAIGGTGTFTFDVDCSDNEFDQGVTIEGSGSKTITGIPTTTSCTVTERSNPLFTSSVLPASGTVSIDAGGENVAFVNTAKPNGLTLDKKVNAGDHATTGDALLAHAGDSLTYTVVITNNGQVPLTITAMSDSLYAGLISACPQAVGSILAAGASFTCTYTVSADGDAHNVAAVSAVDGLGRSVTASDGTYLDVIHPLISIRKTANPTEVSVSGPVTYTYVVTNIGDTALHGIVITDDVIGAIGTVASLAPGASATLTKTVDVNVLTPPTNIGTVVGTDVLGGIVKATDKATITLVLGVELVQPQAQAPAPTLTPAVAPLTELPRTGAPLGTEGRVGIILLQAGLVLGFFGRRRRQVGPLGD